MNYMEKIRRMRRGDITNEAIHARLVAIRKATGFTARDLAASAGMPYTTFKSQESAGAPSLKMIDFYWKSFQVDANFIFGGDGSRILPDTLSEILTHLDDPLANTWEKAGG
ncbi:hypothetical protein [Paracoccus sp. (in: a-proteobacteria)]|uniref:hypothetical protein n=1 Tax=Paracoccus sp. TaxID=267 RepID=UPI003A8C5D6E